jgi:hypothetical protein
MSMIVREDRGFTRQLDRLNQLNQFLSQVATAILPSDDEFESVWNIANRVYDQHCPANVRFIARSRFDESTRTALSA